MVAGTWLLLSLHAQSARRRAHQGCSVSSSHPVALLPLQGLYWGYISFYDTGGYIQELGASLEESRAQLRYLQQHTWIDNM